MSRKFFDCKSLLDPFSRNETEIFFSFRQWDPKITTFPGLYIISSIFLLPLRICSTVSLRSISLIASVLNVLLIYEIRRNVSQKVNSIKIALETLVLSILPPMYLFAHLYYTDIVSVTMVLGMYLFNLKQKHIIASIFGKPMKPVRCKKKKNEAKTMIFSNFRCIECSDAANEHSLGWNVCRMDFHG